MIFISTISSSQFADGFLSPARYTVYVSVRLCQQSLSVLTVGLIVRARPTVYEADNVPFSRRKTAPVHFFLDGF